MDNAQLSKVNKLLSEWLECDGRGEERNRRMLAWAEEVAQERHRAFEAFMRRVLGEVKLDEKAAWRERAAWLAFKLRALFPKPPIKS